MPDLVKMSEFSQELGLIWSSEITCLEGLTDGALQFTQYPSQIIKSKHVHSLFEWCCIILLFYIFSTTLFIVNANHI